MENFFGPKQKNNIKLSLRRTLVQMVLYAAVYHPKLVLRSLAA